MELADKVYFRSYFLKIKTSFTKIETKIDISEIINITKCFKDLMPKAIELAKRFSVTKIVLQLSLPTIQLLQNQIDLLISYMDKNFYIEPDMFFYDIYLLFNYWIKYLESIKNTNDKLNNLYNDVYNYNNMIKLNYKYLKYKSKYTQLKNIYNLI
jgi:hypothetical protein